LKNKIQHIVLVLVLFIPFVGVSQQQNLPLNREFNLVNYKVFNNYETTIHTSFQPAIQSFSQVNDSVFKTLSKSEEKDFLINISESNKKSKRFFKWMYQSAFQENFLVVDTGKFYMTVDPLFDFEYGKDREDTSTRKLYHNTRGLLIKGNIGSKFSFKTSFYENQARYPEYITDFVDASGVVPGQGRVKRLPEGAYDFSMSSAYVSYSPAKFINLQLGTDKHFVGDGYRSLLLSDASFNYPYFKITTVFGKDKFQYTKLHASLQNVNRLEKGSTPEPLFERKAMSVHYLNWLPTKWFSIGLFESTIWQTMDSTGTKPFNFGQLNPVIFVNTAMVGLDGVHNSLVGLNTKFKLPFKTIIYGQYAIDGKDKVGYQAGVRYFGIKNLTLQAEYNQIKPQTYTADIPWQSYSHYNQPLGHPSGNNFSEVVGIINYKYKRLFTQIKFNQIKYRSEIISSTISTPESKIENVQAHLGFVINPKNNMNLSLGAQIRKQETSGLETKTNYIYLTLRTSLRNLYNDF